MANGSERTDSRTKESSYLEMLQQLSPKHPITGETGKLSHLRIGGGFMSPVYTTPSGDRFLLLDDDCDDKLRQAGAEEIIINDSEGFLGKPSPLE